MKKAEYGLTGDFIFKEAVEFLKKKIPLKLGEYWIVNTFSDKFF